MSAGSFWPIAAFHDRLKPTQYSCRQLICSALMVRSTSIYLSQQLRGSFTTAIDQSYCLIAEAATQKPGATDYRSPCASTRQHMVMMRAYDRPLSFLMIRLLCWRSVEISLPTARPIIIHRAGDRHFVGYGSLLGAERTVISP